MQHRRRRFLARASAVAGLAVAGRLIAPLPAHAAERNTAGFQAKSVPEAIKSLGAASAAESKDILIKAPDIAENGAVVPIEVTSRIPGTQSIAIIADRNPIPLVASFDFANGAEPFASTRMKVGQTTNVRALVRAADGKYFVAVREVKVTIGGCGG